MIWFTRGYLEYQFSNYTLQQAPVKQVEFTFEICSEAPGYNEDWPSDITLEPVSYTHLDVYKRQPFPCLLKSRKQ